MSTFKYKKIKSSLPEEIKFIALSTLAWCLLLSLARSQLFSRISGATDHSASFGRCFGIVAFVSNVLDSPVRQKIVAFGSKNSLLLSLLPSAIITSIDPSVKASEGSDISGMSYAIGRQPLRIDSDHIRLSLLNLGLIDSTILPVSLLSKLQNIQKKNIAILELCEDVCSSNSNLGQYSHDSRVRLDSIEIEKYLFNYYPESFAYRKEFCKV